MIASIKDMDEHARAQRSDRETRVEQTEKLEAVATLAGGIAHQFNNALMAVVGNLDLLQLDLPDNPIVARYGGSMRAAVLRMTHLTDQLLAYARGGKYQPRIMSLNEIVEKSLDIVKKATASTIQMVWDPGKDLPEVMVDPAQMQMVLAALVENAKEAIEGVGRIRIATDEVSPQRGLSHISLPRAGRFTCLQVEDNGMGMDEITKARIFEPFFTTKLMGRGLSMAAVYGIVKNHEGWIWVDSGPGKGTRVRILLPAARTAFTRSAQETGHHPLAGRETVLVVEDEAPVMGVCREILERLGYRVLTAETGGKAVAVAMASEEPIDLVILDVQLPDMAATEVYSLMIQARPGLKVLVSSGYDAGGPVQELLKRGALDFLHKPFGFESLSRKVESILKRAQVQAA